MKKILMLIITNILLIGCIYKTDLPINSMTGIPASNYFVISTDSTIIIFNRDSPSDNTVIKK